MDGGQPDMAESMQIPLNGLGSSESAATGHRRNGGDLGLEARLFRMADELRGNIDSAEYKHVVLGLIFLKYISDAFEAKRAELKLEPDADLDDPDEYRADNVFWVPEEARWGNLQRKAKDPAVGKALDDAMETLERDNPKRLRGVLPKDYARPVLDKQRLGRLIDLVGEIGFGQPDDRARDILGRVYEYFLGAFASAEGKRGGEFYTPQPVVRLLVEMLEPRPNSRIYDPCCGSGGMFVQSERFVEGHAGRRGAIAIYGQELNHTTWRLCVMNLAIRGIEAHIEQGDTFHNDQHKDLKADYIMANPPFNVSVWGGERLRKDARWKFGAPPVGNANFAWVQHIIHHLSPAGTAGFVLANGSMSSNTGSEREIRQRMVEADLLDCMVALPGQLFYTTQIPVCLWFLARDKRNGRLRDRRGQTVFIDARKMGRMVSRVQRTLTEADISSIARTYHSWRGEPDAGVYEDVPGFCKSATLEEIGHHSFTVAPGRFVGTEDMVDEEGEPFEERMSRLVATLEKQFADSEQLEAAIRSNLVGLGYGA
jgi:type I restriction enzyme M protein